MTARPDIPELKNDIIGIPGTQQWGQPGLRVGYLAPGGHWDLNADVGLVHRSGTIFSDETAVWASCTRAWRSPES